MTSILPETLKRLINESFDSQTSFAHVAKVERTTLNNDLGGNRKISDDRFAEYLKALPRAGQIELVRARLLDLIPSELHEELVFQKVANQVQDELPRFSSNPALSFEQRSALEWLAEELPRDSQLIEPVMTICERLGWERPQKKTQY